MHDLFSPLTEEEEEMAANALSYSNRYIFMYVCAYIHMCSKPYPNRGCFTCFVVLIV